MLVLVLPPPAPPPPPYFEVNILVNSVGIVNVKVALPPFPLPPSDVVPPLLIVTDPCVPPPAPPPPPPVHKIVFVKLETFVSLPANPDAL